ncbi:MAG TPA: hypothetical protein VGF07_15080 [Stellaceae bacterium]
MSVRLTIEQSPEGLVATISQRDGEGRAVGRPAVSRVASRAEGKRLAKTLARSLGLKVYGIVDKTKSAADPRHPQRTAAEKASSNAEPNVAEEASPPWLVPGVGTSL